MAAKKMLQETAPASTKTASRPAQVTANGTSAPTDRIGEILNRIQVLLEEGKPQEAFDRINAHPASAEIRLKNARGVCLMRMGSYEKAVRVFRELALGSGAGLKDGLPEEIKINFATALMLNGQMAGGLGILSEVEDQTRPSVQQLKSAIHQWKAKVPLLQKINWWLGVDPKVPFQMETPAGELY